MVMGNGCLADACRKQGGNPHRTNTGCSKLTCVTGSLEEESPSAAGVWRRSAPSGVEQLSVFSCASPHGAMR